jgi:hypothetical protein
MAKNLVLLSHFFIVACLSHAQAPKDDNTQKNMAKLDLGLQGIGFTYEQRIGNSTTIDLSLGAGGGYDVSEDGAGFEWNLLQPAFYFMATPKFFYNRQHRIEKGKKGQLNSGNYIGIRLKYTTGSIAPNDYLGSAGLINLHWGMQRSIGKRWTMNAHAGAGYAQNLNSIFGTIYPAIDFKCSYILSKSRG